MPDIESIIAKMPKAENGSVDITVFDKLYHNGWVGGVNAQCRLLAEQGWRKVNDREFMKAILLEFLSREAMGATVFDDDVDFVIEKLLEGDDA